MLGAVILLGAEGSAQDETRPDDWPFFRGADRDGISREKGWKWDQPKVLWRASVGPGVSAVSIKDGRAYTMGSARRKESVWCLDAETGTQLWKHEYDAPKQDEQEMDTPGPRATPTIAEGRVYTIGRDGQIWCLDAQSGKVIWEKDVRKQPDAKEPTWGFAASPVLLADKVIFGVGPAGLALDKADGHVIWTSGKGVPGYATPTRYQQDGKTLLAIFSEKAIYGVDPQLGKVLWNHKWETEFGVNAADPICRDGQIFVSSAYGVGCAMLDVTGSSPKILWRNKEMTNQFATCILWDGHLYGVIAEEPRGDGIKCMDWATGKVKWHQPKLRFCNLSAADGRLVILTEKGELVIAEASPEKYVELARTHILGGSAWTAPSLAGCRLFARNCKGDVACVDLR